MRTYLSLLFATVLTTLCFQSVSAQNSSPYWSLAGNSNASTSSKLGTTNAIPLRFLTKNIERLRIDTLGRVGIGTTAPGSQLQVNAASGVSLLKGQINGSTKLYMSSGGGLSVGSGTSAPSNGLYVSGNVGIGTASPASGSKVDVEAGSNTIAVYAYSSSGTGVFGSSASGKGVQGSGSTYGVYGTGSSNGGAGVYGNGYYGVQGTGSNYGGYFSSLSGSSTSIGLYGTGNSTGIVGAGSDYGVYGTSSNAAYGVYGQSSSTYSSNGSAGVYGNGYYGVHGSGTYGVYGQSTNSGGYGVYGTGDGYGIVGSGGVEGVFGSSSNAGYGVYGASSANYSSNGSAGVYGNGYYGVFGQSGTVGIGVYGHGAYGIYGAGSSWAGYFDGNVYSTGTYQGSDRKLKKNITDFTSAMDIIGKLQPKTYEYRQDGNYELMNLPEGKHYGLIAQDVEQVLPNLVKDTQFDTRWAHQDSAKGQPSRTPTQAAITTQPSEVIDFKAVNYTELIPIVIKGMQEQEAENKAKDERISSLESEVAELRQMVLDMKNGTLTTLTLNSAYLEQNTPNPVSGSTIIRYHLPASITSALLNITNTKGQVIKTMQFTNSSSQVNLNTSMLAAGTYNYSLIVDGKQVDTKRLVVTR